MCTLATANKLAYYEDWKQGIIASLAPKVTSKVTSMFTNDLEKIYCYYIVYC